jgi:Ca2+-binding EF-hand superfamily protein
MVVKEFDKDGDGRLSDDERRAAMKAMRERRMVSSAQGAPAGEPGQNLAAVIKRFDKNGDGKLDEEERAAMRDEMQQRREKRRELVPDAGAVAPKKD